MKHLKTISVVFSISFVCVVVFAFVLAPLVKTKNRLNDFSASISKIDKGLDELNKDLDTIDKDLVEINKYLDKREKK